MRDAPPPREPSRLTPPAKLALALRVWLSFARVRAGVRRTPLPDYVVRLGRSRRRPPRRRAPQLLSLAVHRTLSLGPGRPSCLIRSLVLFDLLRSQGDPAELVIGLPLTPVDKDAHAWVEVDGRDVGPPPGRDGHEPLARFPDDRRNPLPGVVEHDDR